MRLLERSFILYTRLTSLSIRVSRIRAKLVCLSATSKQAKVAPECCHGVFRGGNEDVLLHRSSHATTYCSTYGSAFVLEIMIT